MISFRLRLLALVASTALLAGACARQDTQSTSSPPSTSGQSAFVEDGGLGVVGGPAAGDAGQVSSLVVGSSGDVERFVIGFAKADGLPAARIGATRVELLRSLGLVRVHLPAEILATAIPDNFFGTFAAQQAYVVRRLGGDSMFVDLHLRSPASGRAYALENPALIVVELKPGGPPLSPAAGVSRHAVVVTPRAGRATWPLEIAGYARTFEANVVAELRRGGQIEARTHGTAADYVSTWGEYRLRLDQGQPSGKYELFVGEYSAKDGAEEGTRIELELP